MKTATHTLYLVRHAIAEEPGAGWPDDALRPLTTQGQAKFEKVVRGLAALDVEIAVILASPFLRARQTADLLAEGLPGRPTVVEVPALQPGAAWRQFLPELADYAANAGLALVGHEPSIGELAAHLLGMPVPIEFKKGGVLCVEVEGLPPRGPGRLRWMAPPRLLTRLS